MRWTTWLVLGCLMAAGATAQGSKLVDDAIQEAMAEAKASLESAEKMAGAERIGVAVLRDDNDDVRGFVRMMVTNSKYDLVLTKEQELLPLMEEFARMMEDHYDLLKRRDELLEGQAETTEAILAPTGDPGELPKTANDLALHGVDAVIFGQVREVREETVADGRQQGQRATARIWLHAAGCQPDKAGILVWDGLFEGTAEDLQPLTRDEQLRGVLRGNTILLGIVAAIVVLLVLWVLFRRATMPR